MTHYNDGQGTGTTSPAPDQYETSKYDSNEHGDVQVSKPEEPCNIVSLYRGESDSVITSQQFSRRYSEIGTHTKRGPSIILTESNPNDELDDEVQKSIDTLDLSVAEYDRKNEFLTPDRYEKNHDNFESCSMRAKRINLSRSMLRRRHSAMRKVFSAIITF